MIIMDNIENQNEPIPVTKENVEKLITEDTFNGILNIIDKKYGKFIPNSSNGLWDDLGDYENGVSAIKIMNR